MDGKHIRLEHITPHMNELIAKIQTFDTLSTTDQKSSELKKILTLVEDLRISLNKALGKVEGNTQLLCGNQIERVFNEFTWNVNYKIKPNEYGKFISCCKTLASSVMKMLGRRNCGILVVEMHFKMNLKLINELSGSVKENCNVLKDLLLFQMLIKGFSSSMQVLKRFWYVIVLPEQKCSFMLCLNQSFKTLCFLGKVIDKRLTHLILYLLGRLKQCFQKILDLLFNNEEDSQNSEFIVLMDSCLNKLDHLAYEISLWDESSKTETADVKALKPLLDELLCHAMTVCHISVRENDCESIKCYSQKVLDEYNHMSDGINNPDLGSRADRLSVILCQLEEIVNVAVLNVVLDVFTDVNEPLRKLVGYCDKSETYGDRSADDLEGAISAYDEHMDRIMHIGLFAVSCSTDVKKILGIRSCLASLESMEAELITSVVSQYLHSNVETKATFKYIFRNWLEEVNELKILMELVLDPTAFCKVVAKRISFELYDMKRDDPISVQKIRVSLKKILSYAKKLIKTLMRSMEHDDDEVAKKMKKFVENLRIAYQESEASLALLDQTSPVNELLERIVKRIVIVIRAINNIIHNINDDGDAAGVDHEDFSSIRIIDNDGKLDVYNINAITPEPSTQPDMEVLTPYLNKGKQRTKERTVLYQTPKNPQHFQRTPKALELHLKPWEEGTPTRSRSRCCRPLPRSLELENSLDMELTTLLDNISQLSNTFKTPCPDNVSEAEEPDGEELRRTIPAPILEEGDAGEKIFLGEKLRKKLDKSLNELSNSTALSIHGDSNCQYETPERLHDLTLVQQKINFLMEHMEDQ